MTEQHILTTEDVQKLGIRAIRVYGNRVYAKTGSRELIFEGAQPEVITQFQGKKPAEKAVLPAAAPKPAVAKPAVNPQDLPVIESTTVLDIGSWSDEAIRADTAKKMDDLIALCGSLKETLEYLMERKDGKKLHDDLGKLRDHVNAAWHERGQAIYVEEAQKRGILMNVGEDGLATHDYVGSWQKLTGVNWKTKKPLQPRAVTYSDKAAKAIEALRADGKTPIAKAMELYRGMQLYEELRKQMSDAERQALDQLINIEPI